MFSAISSICFKGSLLQQEDSIHDNTSWGPID